jgi:hypothetical protein
MSESGPFTKGMPEKLIRVSFGAIQSVSAGATFLRKRAA